MYCIFDFVVGGGGVNVLRSPQKLCNHLQRTFFFFVNTKLLGGMPENAKNIYNINSFFDFIFLSPSPCTFSAPIEV